LVTAPHSWSPARLRLGSRYSQSHLSRSRPEDFSNFWETHCL